MKVYGCFMFVPFGTEKLIGLAKTEKAALALLRRKFPHMRGSLDKNNLTSDVNNTYLLNIRELEVEDK